MRGQGANEHGGFLFPLVPCRHVDRISTKRSRRTSSHFNGLRQAARVGVQRRRVAYHCLVDLRSHVSPLAAVPLCVKNPLGFPHLVQLPLFAAIFGGSGCVSYMVHVGDPVNGSGTTTGPSSSLLSPCRVSASSCPVFLAWSLTYLFLNGRKALVSRRPGPIALAAAAAAQAGTYGWYYSKT
ncbi:SPOSA6832_00591, partial [Sporobolomyces salmonicolor]